jgi:3-hydroxybutyryl-CoA dehydrogenase
MGVGVVGAGTMGLGIVHAFATSGFEVVLVESSTERRDAAVAALRAVLESGLSRGKVTRAEVEAALDRTTAVTSVDELPEGLDLVVEAVPELPDLKRELLARIERRGPRILGTNTSSISIDQLAVAVADPARLLGVHYFNPVWAKKLVELVVGSATDPAVVVEVQELMAATGKEAIVVRDAPGFASSRLGVLLGLEAMRMVEEGVASPEDIDTAMTLGYGHPMGPLRLTDLVGLDVRLDIARNLQKTYGDRFAPPALLQELVAKGDLGKKTGKGFFSW